MIYWYNKPLIRPIRAAQYKVGDTVVYVAGRPDYERQGTSELIDLTDVEGWLSVTDRFVPHPLGHQAWHPWRESGPPKPEVLFGTLKTLHYWIDELKLSKVFIHCDAGTHRSVTVFGAYLDTYHSDEARPIVDAKVLHGRSPEHWSDPLLYWNSYVEEFPELKLLTEAIKNTEDDPSWGNESLDHLLDRKKSS